ncbi:glutaminyl-peptide cyclotransferase [Flavihumibacter solisilvae]|uniref:Glutamine cyclotransferase n=1 Tax=Flavihumibacter solisilvae TaxID=1349421 RepID=A0A0C1L4H1_9BACT|nr:glutaminyl-peptide cyclotransferase [Flavihumibacter solisilvae]KIC94481.1 hypothetical protein OI18_11440 [Flavihumibacter solisilvae]
MNHLKFAASLFVLSLLGVACNNADNTSGSEESTSATAGSLPAPPALRFNVLNVFPHDTSSFTQGLLFYKGQLMESTGGQPGVNAYRSWVGKVDLQTGKADKKIFLDTAYFGEGIATLNDKLYQLTWSGKKGFVYDAATLKKEQEFPLKTEGWGVTTDSTYLIVSDGSSNLYYLDPKDFSTKRVLGVTDNNGPVNNLNELEYINGHIYANKWQTNYILKIDPSNGQVIGRADLTGLLLQYGKGNISREKYNDANGEAVLNGIAYDPGTKKLYVTGKLWPNLFEIDLQ